MRSQLSQRPRAIIKARGLQNNIVDISPGFLASTVVATDPGKVKFVGIVCMLVGFFVPLVYRGYDSVGILLFLGIFLLVAGFYQDRKLKKGEADFIAIKNFFNAPVSIRAFNPVHAKEVDAHVRQSLASLKGFIEGSETLAPKDTFEL